MSGWMGGRVVGFAYTCDYVVYIAFISVTWRWVSYS